MGLTGRLLRSTAARPHVLVVAAPGSTAIRLDVERQLAARGWPASGGPADADVLALCGTPEPRLAAAVEAAWAQLPGPRVRLHLTAVRDVAATLDEAPAGLADLRAQRADARQRPAQPQPPEPASPDGMDMGGMGSGGMDMAGMDMSGMDTAGMDMGGMDMGGMEMPAGLGMADRAEDRDGLKLDQLHLRLGPVLPDWPAGLVLDLTLQGDVVQHAAVDTWTGPRTAEPFWAGPARRARRGEPVPAGQVARYRAAADLDSAGRLLAVAGWADRATAARRLRDDLLSGAGDSAGLERRARQLAARVTRSATLRWSLRGLGRIDADPAGAGSTADPRPPGSDVHDRLCRWLTDAVHALGPDGPGSGADHPGAPGGDAGPTAAVVRLLPSLVTGLDLAAVRLVVASLDPDLDAIPDAIPDPMPDPMPGGAHPEPAHA